MGNCNAEVSVGEGGWIRFRTTRVVASLIEQIRAAMEGLLQEKIANPCVHVLCSCLFWYHLCQSTAPLRTSLTRNICLHMCVNFLLQAARLWTGREGCGQRGGTARV